MIRAIAGYGIQVPPWKVRTLINSLVCWKGKSMSVIVTIGIDLAKNVFAVHGIDATGKPVLVRPNVPRAKLLELMALLPPCLIGMEACSGAHHWARKFARFGHGAPDGAQVLHPLPPLGQTRQERCGRCCRQLAGRHGVVKMTDSSGSARVTHRTSLSPSRLP